MSTAVNWRAPMRPYLATTCDKLGGRHFFQAVVINVSIIRGRPLKRTRRSDAHQGRHTLGRDDAVHVSAPHSAPATLPMHWMHSCPSFLSISCLHLAFIACLRQAERELHYSLSSGDRGRATGRGCRVGRQCVKEHGILFGERGHCSFRVFNILGRHHASNSALLGPRCI
jgi:hypothetical protein